MHPSPCSTSAAPPGRAIAEPKANQPNDRIYQGLTIAAMLLSLASLWLFW